MARINNYAVKSLNENDKLLASDGNTGGTKNVSPIDVAEMNGGASIYRAFLTQSGTSTPIATVVGPNTIGDIVWTRIGTGRFRGILSGAFGGHVAVVVCPNGNYTFDYNTLSSDYVYLGTFDMGSYADSVLDGQYIEIRIYES
jgi:hypothetical protein